jgi:hypothetical protein
MSDMIATMRMCNSEYPTDDLPTPPLSSPEPSAEFFMLIKFF